VVTEGLDVFGAEVDIVGLVGILDEAGGSRDVDSWRAGAVGVGECSGEGWVVIILVIVVGLVVGVVGVVP